MDNAYGNRAFTGASTSNASSPLTTRPDNLLQLNDSVWEFYKPSHPNGVPKMEVVFFHGAQLSKDTEAFWKTWLSRDDTVVWPTAWLAQKFPEGRMLFISYDSSVQKSSGQKDMYQAMENLMYDIIWSSTCRAGQKCPVILVGHCFGGIIIKQFLIRCCELTGLEHADVPRIRKIKLFLEHCKAIFYYSTPNGGSDLTDGLASIDKILCKVNKSLVDFLEVLSPQTARINTWFSRLRHSPNRKWETRGIGETLKTNLNGSMTMVVSQASAMQDLDSVYWVDDDHFNVSKAKNAVSCNIFLMLWELIDLYYNMSSSSTIRQQSFTTVPASFDDLFTTVVSSIEKVHINTHETEHECHGVTISDKPGSFQEVGMSSDAPGNPGRVLRNTTSCYGTCSEPSKLQTVLCVGEVGAGKSTLCNMLLFSDVEGEFKTWDCFHVDTQVVTRSNFEWTVIDTVGLGFYGDRAMRTLKAFLYASPMDVDHICYVRRKGRFTESEMVYWESFLTMFRTVRAHIRLIVTSADVGSPFHSYNDMINDYQYPSIGVDFPPRRDDSDQEELFRKIRERDLKRLRKFLYEQSRLTGGPVNTGQIYSRLSEEDGSKKHLKSSALRKLFESIF